MSRKPEFTNRLIHEKSPYLLQHAHNPVDWYPWSQEAFTAAQEADKPIFLSIGYATCHWCHTMEEESFEDLEVAQLLNDTFINIKVDREELPEVDVLYMDFAQSMMSGAAGWPLNVVLTPELFPFFAATYLPPRPSKGMMGLTDLIQKIREVWGGEERERVMMQAAQIVEVFAQNQHVKGDRLPQITQVIDTAEMLFKMADPIYGGIKGFPKFPIGYQANFMLNFALTTEDNRGVFLVEKTLDMMHRGGIYDHLGGGFSRYSVDDHWMVPHFEKMLFDNAFLVDSYLSAWKATKNDFYREVCEDIIAYVLRDMSHPEGGYYSAQDADSEGEEGLFYTWTLPEVHHVLGDTKETELFCAYYHIMEYGGFEGRNVLHLEERIEEFANSKGLDPEELKVLLDKLRLKLWKAREKREHPFKDDKILSPPNGIMIHSLALAGDAFQNQKYIDSAVRSAKFIRENLWVEGQLLRRWREGEASYVGGLDDYAYMIKAVLTLFEIGQGSEWLEWAVEMSSILNHHFKEEDGAFYLTDGLDTSIVLRKCQFSDGSEPSGNAIHTENLLRLYQIGFDPFYLTQAEDVLRAVNQFLDEYAPGYCYHAMNLNRYYDPKKAVILISFNDQNEHEKELKQLLSKPFLPHVVRIWRRNDDQVLFRLIPFLKEQGPHDGKTTLYICREGVCERPITDLSEMIEVVHRM